MCIKVGNVYSNGKVDMKVLRVQWNKVCLYLNDKIETIPVSLLIVNIINGNFKLVEGK